MELHSPGMSTIDPIGQWIKTGIRSVSLDPGEISTPGVEIRSIEGIRTGAHLEKDCIEAAGFGVVQNHIRLSGQFFRRCSGSNGIVQVGYGGYPDTTHLFFGGYAGGKDKEKEYDRQKAGKRRQQTKAYR